MKRKLEMLSDIALTVIALLWLIFFTVFGVIGIASWFL